MKCPRCQTGIPSAPDPNGFIVCPGCGSRLRRAAPGPAPAAATGPTGVVARRPTPVAAVARRTEEDPQATPLHGISTDAVREQLAARDLEAAPRTARMRAFSPPGHVSGSASLDEVMAELGEIRRVQEEILAALRGGRAEVGAASLGASADDAPAVRPVLRSGRRKSVLVIDDDETSRAEMMAAFQSRDVPARAVSEGNAALAAIAEDKPDVIVLELGVGGAMAGKDVVNMIKATMEWVDIPILLYTRVPIESQKDARTIHGADDFVVKGPGGPEAVVAKTITFFRKG